MQPITLEVQVLLAQIAEGRAIGTTWEQLAITMKRPVEELRRLPFLYPDAWQKQLATAQRDKGTWEAYLPPGMRSAR